jgi:hypothetical protein
MQVTVRIDVNDPGLTVLGDAEVHPAIVPASERLEGGERRLDDPPFQLQREGAGNRGAVDALG